MGLYEDMRVFSKVCEVENFSKAAKFLNMSSSSVSKAIKRFEESTGETLLIRNTHSIALTNIGKILFDKSKFLIGEMNEISSLVQAREINEALKITFCNDCKHLFQKEFLSLVEETKITKNIVICESSQEKERFDFVSSRSDFYLFIGVPKESSLIARKLADCNYQVYVPLESVDSELSGFVGHSSFYSTRNRKLNLPFKLTLEVSSNFIFDNYKDSFDYAVKKRLPVLLPDIFQNEIIANNFKKLEQDLEPLDTNDGIYLCYFMKKHKANQLDSDFIDCFMDKLKRRIEVL